MRQLPKPVSLSDAINGPLVVDPVLSRYEQHAPPNTNPGLLRAALILAGAKPGARVFAVPGPDIAFVCGHDVAGRTTYTSYRVRDATMVTTSLVGQSLEAAVAIGAAVLMKEEPLLMHAVRPLVAALRAGASAAEIGVLAAKAAGALGRAIETEIGPDTAWYCAAKRDRSEIDEAGEPLAVDLAARFTERGFLDVEGAGERRLVRQALGL